MSNSNSDSFDNTPKGVDIWALGSPLTIKGCATLDEHSNAVAMAVRRPEFWSVGLEDPDHPKLGPNGGKTVNVPIDWHEEGEDAIGELRTYSVYRTKQALVVEHKGPFKVPEKYVVPPTIT